MKRRMLVLNKNSHAVSGGEVTVNELEVGQVSHSLRDLNGKDDQLFDSRLLQRQHTSSGLLTPNVSKSKRVKRVKSFPSLTAQWAALISVPLALSQTPAYTAKTAVRGQCIARCVRLLPRGEAGTKLYCLVTEAHGCEQLAQSCYLVAARPGIELTKSQ